MSGFDYPFHCGSLYASLRSLLNAEDEWSREIAEKVGRRALEVYDQEMAAAEAEMAGRPFSHANVVPLVKEYLRERPYPEGPLASRAVESEDIEGYRGRP